MRTVLDRFMGFNHGDVEATCARAFGSRIVAVGASVLPCWLVAQASPIVEFGVAVTVVLGTIVLGWVATG